MNDAVNCKVQGAGSQIEGALRESIAFRCGQLTASVHHATKRNDATLLNGALRIQFAIDSKACYRIFAVCGCSSLWYRAVEVCLSL